MPDEPNHGSKKRTRNRSVVFNSAAMVTVAVAQFVGRGPERSVHHVLYALLLLAAGTLAVTSGIVTFRNAYRSRRAD